MGYMHIPNLYRPEAQKILEFKWVYVTSKIHGTSAHISWNPKDNMIHFFSGGSKYEQFLTLFDYKALEAVFIERYKDRRVMLYGEAYGGSQQKMSHTYGPDLKFIVFDVMIDDHYVDVPTAERIANHLGLEFVWWTKSSTDEEELNKYRDQDDPQAIRNGMGEGHKQEGIVIRPPFEFLMNNGEPLRVKHKRDDFAERVNTPKNPEDIKVLEEAKAIADEWTTPMRFFHVIDKIPNILKRDEFIPIVINAMVEDVYREAKDEIVEGKKAKQEIARATVSLFKRWCNGHLVQG